MSDVKFLVLQIGCIECGVSSYPIATHKTLDEAKKAADDHPSTWESEGGEGYVVVIDLEQCKRVYSS